MIDLHRGILELFAEAARLGTRRHALHWQDLGHDERERAPLKLPVSEPFMRASTEVTLLTPRERRSLCKQRGRAGRLHAPAVVERPIYAIVTLPHVRFACPRGCGALIRQNAGVSRKNAMGTHSCPNAVGHVAARR